MSRRVNKTGRNETQARFVALPHHVLKAPAYAALSCPARAVLVEIAMAYDGKNNGNLVASVRMLAERCGTSKDTAARAIQELEDAGFIYTTSKGAFRTSNRRASEFRICWRKCDITGALPSHGFHRS